MASPFTPASSRGSTFNGGTITEPLIVDMGTGTGTAIGVRRTGSPDPVVALDAEGGIAVSPPVTSTTRPIDIQLPSGEFALRALAPDFLGFMGGGARVITGGAFATGLHSAPANADIPPGWVAIWFDSTDGVGNTKLMFKGKSDDGTVKTAAVVLA